MNRSVIVHGAVLGASLIAAYLVWTREPSTADEDAVPILRFHKVDKVVFKSTAKTVQVERKKDGQGTYPWVQVVQREAPIPKKGIGKPRAPAVPARASKIAPGKPAVTPPAAKIRRPAKTLRAPKPAQKKSGKPTAGPPSLSQNPKTDPAKSQTPTKAAKPKGPKAAAASPPAAKTVPERLSAGSKTAPATSPASPPPVPAATPASVASKPKRIEKRKEFIGNEAADKLLESMARLEAVRSIGQLGREKLAELGLIDSKTTLSIVSGATERKFNVGGRAYGNLDYYIKDTATQRVYVIRQAVVEQLKNAEHRLKSAALHAFALKDVDRVIIASRDRRLTLRQHDRNKADKAYWTEEGSEDKKGNDSYRNWLQKLDRLRIVNYTLSSDPPKGLTELATVDYYGGATKKGFVRLFEQPSLAPDSLAPDRGPVASQGANKHYLVSEHTRVPVEGYKARLDEVVKALDDLFK